MNHECQSHIFPIATLIHKWYSCSFHRLNRQDGVNQENLDYSYEGIKFFLFELKNYCIHFLNITSWNTILWLKWRKCITWLPPKFQRRQDWGKIYTATQRKECLFNCIFFFYVLCILILEGSILNKTKLLVGLFMNNDC